jgi:hypothetical protein
MLAAYEGRFSDTVPVAPEFWLYIPARIMGLPVMEIELEIPRWKCLQIAFQHFDCEGWGCIAPEIPDGAEIGERSIRTRLDEDRVEVLNTIDFESHSLQSRSIYSTKDPSWVVERYIKDFERDWPIYAQMTFIPPDELDWKPVQKAIEEVGEDFLLEVFVGLNFIDYIGKQRQGGFEQVIFDLIDREDFMLDLQKRYKENITAKVFAAFNKTSARSVYVGCDWSSLSLLSPSIWRKWDKPVLKAVVKAAHECGGLVHHHIHGKCMQVLPELVEIGLDCICPFERPPGGDVMDLQEVREILGNQTTFNGNIHTVETLIRGNPEDVRREVLEILEAFSGSPRLILGTGDQVGAETPDENIYAMIETARKYGKWI